MPYIREPDLSRVIQILQDVETICDDDKIVNLIRRAIKILQK